jgi:hypothetical protein
MKQSHVSLGTYELLGTRYTRMVYVPLLQIDNLTKELGVPKDTVPIIEAEAPDRKGFLAVLSQLSETVGEAVGDAVGTLMKKPEIIVHAAIAIAALYLTMAIFRLSRSFRILAKAFASRLADDGGDQALAEATANLVLQQLLVASKSQN